MKHRVLTDPTFFIETGELLSHNGESFVEDFPIKADRQVQATAKGNANTATNTGSQYGAQAQQIGSSFIPGLERDANNPTGLTPTEKNDQLVSGAEAIGGANSGVVGQANLAAARTRNAGGFASALDEAARIKGRQLSTNTRAVGAEDARIAQAKQQQARQLLSGLYGTDVSGQLHAMGVADQDLNTELNAGKTGWLQDVEGVLDTGANVAKAFKPRPIPGS